VALPPELEARLLHHYHVEKWRNGTIARHLGIHPSTVQRFLEQAGLPRIGTAGPSLIDAHWPFICQTLAKFPTLATSRLFEMVRQRGYNGSNSHFRHVIANRRPRFDAFKWMLALLQKKIKPDDLKHQLGDMSELEALRNRLYNGGLFDRNKSMTILARQRGITVDKICSFLGISISTYNSYKRAFINGGSQALFSRKPKIKRSDDEALKSEIFKVLHQPPNTYGINRTSWTMPLLRRILRENGKSACPDVIRSITLAAGYRWRKARVVLTSTDPTYSDKLQRIHSILSNLKSDEVFFSIDEYGPIAVKMYGGRKLVPSGERPVVPQWQKSRGSLIITAALELSTNQITHFYSKKRTLMRWSR
jgi:transposase